jgi:large conductance mechanosensitive channel
VIKSLVADVIMPVVSGIFSLPDFSNLFVVLSGEGDFTSVEMAREAGASVLAYGSFINAMIAFLLLALAVFFVIKAINAMKKAEEAAPSGPSELDVLQEIRDSLKK